MRYAQRFFRRGSTFRTPIPNRCHICEVEFEHVFAHQKHRMGLVIRTIGLKRAEAKIGLANLAYNFQRLIFHERRAAMA